MTKSTKLTNATGAPVPDNTNIRTAGPRGLASLEDVWRIENLAHRDREVNATVHLNPVSVFSSTIWVLLTQAPGDNDQCLALAEALGRPVAVKNLDWRVADREEDRAMTRELLADTLDAERWRRSIGLQAPWPRMVICCGRRSDKVAFWIKKQSSGYTKVVCIGRARRPVESYDLLIALPHFIVPERSNVINLPLPPMRRRGQIGHALSNGLNVPVPRPWFTILLGGEIKQFAASKRALAQVARQAQVAADVHGGTVVVSTSRRTPRALLAAVERELDGPYIYRWSSTAAGNPYDTLLQHSAALFVTADSASMILDGVMSGTPTYVIEYPAGLDLRGRWRRGASGFIRRLIALCYGGGFAHAGAGLDWAQEWLHAHHVLRYPRDLKLFYASIYNLGLARRMASFDPALLPERRDVANDVTDVSGLQDVVARCRALLTN